MAEVLRCDVAVIGAGTVTACDPLDQLGPSEGARPVHEVHGMPASREILGHLRRQPPDVRRKRSRYSPTISGPSSGESVRPSFPSWR